RMLEAGLAQEKTGAVAPPTASAAPGPRELFAPALAALEQEHSMNRRPTDARPPETVKAIAGAAAEARIKMRRWAAEPDLLLTAAEAIERQRQSLLLEAN